MGPKFSEESPLCSRGEGGAGLTGARVSLQREEEDPRFQPSSYHSGIGMPCRAGSSLVVFIFIFALLAPESPAPRFRAQAAEFCIVAPTLHYRSMRALFVFALVLSCTGG